MSESREITPEWLAKWQEHLQAMKEGHATPESNRAINLSEVREGHEGDWDLILRRAKGMGVDLADPAGDRTVTSVFKQLKEEEAMDENEKFLRIAFAAAAAAYEANPTFNPIIAAAQAALESNWGRSQLAVEANNLKGVKAGSSWKGDTIELPTREYRPADDTWYTTIARWRKYRDWIHAFEDYADLIQRVYPHAAAVAGDARSFLEALTERDYPKYATDPNYVEKVWQIVNIYSMVDWTAEKTNLLIVLDANNKELFRANYPEDARIITNAGPDKTYVRISTEGLS